MNLELVVKDGWICSVKRSMVGMDIRNEVFTPISPALPEVIFEKLNENAVIPVYASEGDSGMDVYATEDMIIEPDQTKLAKLGFKMEIPRHPLHDFGYRWECQARPRSGVSLKTMLRVANSTGTIDNFYRNEVGIILTNSKSPNTEKGITDRARTVGNEEYVLNYSEPLVPKGSYIIKKGDRIAQLVFAEVVRPMKMTEGTVDTDTDRKGGFGSTGVK